MSLRSGPAGPVPVGPVGPVPVGPVGPVPVGPVRFQSVQSVQFWFSGFQCFRWFFKVQEGLSGSGDVLLSIFHPGISIFHPKLILEKSKLS